LLSSVSIQLPLLAAVGFALLNLVVVATLLPETHPPAARIPLPRRRQLQPVSQLAAVFRNGRVRRIGLAFFLFFLAFNGFTAVLVLYFKQAFGWGPGLSANAFLVVGVVAIVVQGGLIGPLVQRLGEGRLTLLGLVFVVLGCLLILLIQPAVSVPMVFVAVAILAFGTGLVTPCLRSLVSRRLDDGGQGAALGSLQGLQSLSSVLGPPLAGLTYETLGRRSPFWLGIALLLVVALLLGGGLARAADPSPSRLRG
jgi:Na+/melibiose symporter-like transporter